jgi:predicted TIM-barrel fold metal-dependent hydrolase
MHRSFRHMLDADIDHDVRYYWDNHMYSAFMVDPLGLEVVDRIGTDRVMWSSDYPHNESTFGYSERSLDAVVAATGPETAARIVSCNVVDFLGLPANG